MDTARTDGHAVEQSGVQRIYPGKQEAEPILMEGHLSLMPSLVATALLCLFVTASILTLLLLQPGLNAIFNLMSAAWLGCLVLIGAQGALELVARLNTRFVLTQRNLYLKRGVMRRWHKTLAVWRIQDVVVEQGPLGMLFHYGNIRVDTVGERCGVVLADVPNPLVWRTCILLATAQAAQRRTHPAFPI
jgi:membrane protein YdbS with pleckstrin-like domain